MSVPIVLAALSAMLVRVAWINAAVGICTRSGRHALVVRREVAVTRVAPLLPMQAITTGVSGICSEGTHQGEQTYE